MKNIKSKARIMCNVIDRSFDKVKQLPCVCVTIKEVWEQHLFTKGNERQAL